LKRTATRQSGVSPCAKPDEGLTIEIGGDLVLFIIWRRHQGFARDFGSVSVTQGKDSQTNPVKGKGKRSSKHHTYHRANVQKGEEGVCENSRGLSEKKFKAGKQFGSREKCAGG